MNRAGKILWTIFGLATAIPQSILVLFIVRPEIETFVIFRFPWAATKILIMWMGFSFLLCILFVGATLYRTYTEVDEDERERAFERT